MSTPPEFSAAVRRGDEAFQYKEYEKAVAAYRTYLDQTDHGLYTARTFYKSALAQYRLGHYREVLTTLDELSERYPKEHWVQVEVLRGDTAHAMGHPTAALEAWDAAWKIGGDAERQQLRQRILSTARQLSDPELAGARQVVSSDDVAELLDQQVARRQTHEINEPIPDESREGETMAKAPSRVPAPAQAAAPKPGTKVAARAVTKVTEQAPATRPAESPKVAAEVGNGGSASLPGRAALAEAPQVEPVQGTAKVGCMLPLSGPSRQLGQRSLRALRLAFGAESDRLVVKDTGSDPVTAANMLDELARDPSVLVVIGPLEGDVAQGVAPRAEQAHLPLLLLSPGGGPTGPFVLQAGVGRSGEVHALLEYAMEKVRLRRFGVLYPKDAHGKELLEAFRTEVERRGGTVVGAGAYPPGSENVASDVRIVKKWRQAQNLQAVFLPDSATAAAGFAKSLQETMPDVTLLGVHGWEGLASPDGALNGVLFAEDFYGGSARAGTRAFVAAFLQTYDEAPGVAEAQAYDAALLARRALDTGARSRSDLLRQLRGLGPVEAATGELKVTAEGVQRIPFLLQVYDGKLQEVSAPPA
ncbi:MAG TPA: ABC transporter substrate-binding protein [Candidatus Binatia bacterium]